MQVAVVPLVSDDHVVPVDLSGAPRPLGPGEGALLIGDPLVVEGKHTELT